MFNPFKKKYSKEELDLIAFMAQTRHFEKLDEDELALFLPSMYLRTYQQDEVVFFSGDPSHALYVIKRGSVSLSIDVNDKFEQLAETYRGGIFGDNSLIEDAKRIYTTVITSEKAQLYVIPQINILEIFQSHPEVKAKMMSAFSEIYNEYTTQLFKTYKSHFGFFELSKVYQGKI
ncbi:cyclic nucleotide-binding domain-containing protein [Reichenbachiella sp.]|uniref:cyclic nucleotide-binding domain-containing protein n=1 Tax=Reichenbachiella sp. TaxID=2184521 RepID=UPI003B5CF472